MVPAEPPTTAAPMAEGGAVATAEELTGANVQDLEGTSIGSISDLQLNGDAVTGVIINVGGFLGLGAKPVLIPVEQIDVIRDADGTVLHVEVGMSREQLEAMPEHVTQ
ncbi:PRC-barrel protein (plasmid) [Ketogulonicigenium vulgare Y25]|uniref:PRC-barrel n=2 Tax=Ketogulonicigenium vulgare TaxID=92945 RepID=F9YBN9_KETVW|nr:PRC-barrel protein [Ketogulonicigenium vulgare Y25]AEM42791.1 PRC-barrel [Ketogulonicigenium vulgare WSH-001]ALJ82880.1 photosystem reaction center subunit H [Ketogulonicigenium vulgare]